MSKQVAIPKMKIERCVLTLAVGKDYYLSLAIALARSFKVWHQQSKIRFVLITDQPQKIPADLSDIEIVQVSVGELGVGYEAKLHLDKMTPGNQTLFVDADCLCLAPLEPVFERFAGHAFSTVGTMISQGDFFGDVAERCRRFQVSTVPYFVGAIYYFELTDTCRRVFERARALRAEYDEAGFKRLAQLCNEEPLLSVGMALERQCVIADDLSIKADLMYFDKKVDISVFSGKSRLTRGAEPWLLGPSAALPKVVSPRIAHFNANQAERGEYLAQALELELVYAKRWPRIAAQVWGFLRYAAPDRLLRHTKDILRPVYHRCFGPRPVKKTRRQIGVPLK